MKKMLCILLVAILVFAAARLQISARGKYSRLLLLGDSITYGYGLGGTRDTCTSYGNHLAKHLGTSGKNFMNAAVNGHTSADLLGLLPSLAGDIAAADLIVVSIGGNDLLAILWDAVRAVSGGPPVYTEVAEALNDPEYIGSLARQISVQTITDAIICYTENLERIVGFIRAKNPGAVVIFLAQYDPASGAGFPEEVSAVTAGSIMLLNAAMREVVASGGCVWLDIHSAFVGKGPEWTFINEGDIHPNATGHYMIYRFIVEYLETGLQPGETAPVTDESLATTISDTKPPDTTPHATTTVRETTTAPATRLPTAGEGGAIDREIKRCGCKGSVSLSRAFACILCFVMPAWRKPKNRSLIRLLRGR